MLQDLADEAGVSQPVAVLLIIVAVVQIGLAIVALADLVRRERVAGGRKWLWALLILFGNLAGSVLYLAIGRNPEPEPVDDHQALEEAPQSRAERIRRNLDALYGPAELRP